LDANNILTSRVDCAGGGIACCASARTLPNETIRQALQILRLSGFIPSSAGAGTVLRRPAPERRYFRL
jgi:hypothetical protein